MQGRREEKKPDRRNLLILLLLLLTIFAVGVTIWALFFRETQSTLAPDYAPQEEEEYAQPIPDDSGEKLEEPENGGAVSLTYSNQAEIDLSDADLTLLFANPGKSNQDMVVQVIVQDIELVRSGRLEPGHQVTRLDLLPGAADKLSPGGYDGKFVVSFYQLDTGEKAVVNTEIPIFITVKN